MFPETNQRCECGDVGRQRRFVAKLARMRVVTLADGTSHVNGNDTADVPGSL